MLGQILTESNALSFFLWGFGLLGGIVVLVVGWQINKLITNLESLDKTVTENNVYQKQHFSMLKKHEGKLDNYGVRLVKLEMSSNGKGS